MLRSCRWPLPILRGTLRPIRPGVGTAPSSGFIGGSWFRLQLGDTMTLRNETTTLTLPSPNGFAYTTTIPPSSDAPLNALPTPVIGAGQWTWGSSGGPDLPASNFSFSLAAPIQINGGAPVSVTSSQDQTMTWNGTAYDSNAILQLSVSQNPGFSPAIVCFAPAQDRSPDDSSQSACAIHPRRSGNVIGIGNGIGFGNSSCEFHAFKWDPSVDAGEPGKHRYASGGFQMRMLVSGGVFLALSSLLQAQTATVQNAATLRPPAAIFGNFESILKGRHQHLFLARVCPFLPRQRMLLRRECWQFSPIPGRDRKKFWTFWGTASRAELARFHSIRDPDDSSIRFQYSFQGPRS